MSEPKRIDPGLLEKLARQVNNQAIDGLRAMEEQARPVSWNVLAQLLQEVRHPGIIDREAAKNMAIRSLDGAEMVLETSIKKIRERRAALIGTDRPWVDLTDGSRLSNKEMAAETYPVQVPTAQEEREERAHAAAILDEAQHDDPVLAWPRKVLRAWGAADEARRQLIAMSPDEGDGEDHGVEFEPEDGES